MKFTYKDKAAQELVRQMLRHQPSERLPMRVGGSNNMKKHEWYEGFDWDGAYKQDLKPPYIPVVKSKTDTANFRA